MKIIAVGDQHFQAKNELSINVAIKKLKKYLEEEKPDIIVLLGDLLHDHERLHSIVMSKAYKFVEDMSKIAFTYILVGNHDYINNQQFLTEKHWLNVLKEKENIKVVDKVVIDEGICFCPYVPNGRFIEALDTKDGWKESKLIFAHQELSGVKMGHIISKCEDWDINNPLVITGHIHSKQEVQKNLYYPGSLLQHAFGESKQNIILKIQLNESELKKEEIDLKLPRKKTINCKIENIESKLDKIEKNKDELRVIIEGKVKDIKKFKKSLKYEKIKDKCKIVFKLDKDEELYKVESLNNKLNVKEIILKLITKEKNKNLNKLYKEFIK